VNGSLPGKKHDPFASLRIRDYSLFFFARFFLTLGIQMQGTVLGWHVYQITGNVLAIGIIGLAEALPFIFFSFFSGHVADAYNRKKVIILNYFFLFLQALFLFFIALNDSELILDNGLWLIYAGVILWGIIRAFIGPAYQALVAQIVPKELFGNSTTWSSFVWHFAAIAGPALGGGLCIIMDFSDIYLLNAALVVVSLCLFVFIRPKPAAVIPKGESFTAGLKKGIEFVMKKKIILGAISLDMFAVLFGGAVAMLPVIADKIIHSNLDTAAELGILRAAPAVGSVIMSAVMVFFPPFRNAGRNLLLSVFIFGALTILFALSTNLYISAVILLLTGMFDNVSVVIRHTILQVHTPDEMRGRVSAVNGIFIGSSNEIGAFESGLAAKLLGLIPSIIFGGVMTMLIVVSMWFSFPFMRKMNIKKDLKE